VIFTGQFTTFDNSSVCKPERRSRLEVNAHAQWFLVALLVLHAHFAASYIVPLDKDGQRAFGGPGMVLALGLR
jgi:hypothetical protein